ncbi:MAG: hypothetical protein J7J11_00970 [Desulfurococcales archaeon]|nr:hypothetical protein [Desulfurococcales archaeon]
MMLSSYKFFSTCVMQDNIIVSPRTMAVEIDADARMNVIADHIVRLIAGIESSIINDM